MHWFRRDDERRIWLRWQLEDTIDLLELPEMEMRFLRARWLGEFLRVRERADKTRARYYGLRIIVLAGGATTTAFASLKLSGSAQSYISGLIFAFSLITTIAAGLLELLKPGDEWRSLDALAERLAREGWLYFGLTGEYGDYPGATYHHGFARFSRQVEEILSNAQDVSAIQSLETARQAARAEASSPPAMG